MNFIPTSIEGVVRVVLEKRSDERGSFARVWCQHEFEEAGLSISWLQANAGRNTVAGTLRGMHYQRVPFAEWKLVRCTKGRIFDVAVDLRRDSPSYRNWVGAELDDEEGDMLLIPPGCAHGYITLADNSEILYFTSQFYEPAAATGVRFDDPAFAISWPRPVGMISTQDEAWPDWEEQVLK
jgi:dTDP-4-dehydrorhamnose 3,5-epimerase